MQNNSLSARYEIALKWMSDSINYKKLNIGSGNGLTSNY